MAEDIDFGRILAEVSKIHNDTKALNTRLQTLSDARNTDLTAAQARMKAMKAHHLLQTSKRDQLAEAIVKAKKDLADHEGEFEATKQAIDGEEAEISRFQRTVTSFEMPCPDEANVQEQLNMSKDRADQLLAVIKQSFDSSASRPPAQIQQTNTEELETTGSPQPVEQQNLPLGISSTRQSTTQIAPQTLEAAEAPRTTLHTWRQSSTDIVKSDVQMTQSDPGRSRNHTPLTVRAALKSVGDSKSDDGESGYQSRRILPDSSPRSDFSSDREDPGEMGDSGYEEEEDIFHDDYVDDKEVAGATISARHRPKGKRCTRCLDNDLKCDRHLPEKPTCSQCQSAGVPCVPRSRQRLRQTHGTVKKSSGSIEPRRGDEEMDSRIDELRAQDVSWADIGAMDFLGDRSRTANALKIRHARYLQRLENKQQEHPVQER